MFLPLNFYLLIWKSCSSQVTTKMWETISLKTTSFHTLLLGLYWFVRHKGNCCTVSSFKNDSIEFCLLSWKRGFCVSKRIKPGHYHSCRKQGPSQLSRSVCSHLTQAIYLHQTDMNVKLCPLNCPIEASTSWSRVWMKQPKLRLWLYVVY